MSIAGKYTLQNAENNVAFFKALGATDEQVEKAQDGEVKGKNLTLSGSGDSFTIDFGAVKSSFKIGQEYETALLGGKLKLK